jgi:hypothetical protein
MPVRAHDPESSQAYRIPLTPALASSQILDVWRSLAKFARHAHQRHQQNAYETPAQNTG